MLPLQRGKIQQADTLMARCPSLWTQCCINNNKNWKRVLLSKRGLSSSSSSSSSVLSAGETFHHPSSWLWFQLSGRSLKEGLNDKILLNTVIAAPWQRRTNLACKRTWSLHVYRLVPCFKLCVVAQVGLLILCAVGCCVGLLSHLRNKWQMITTIFGHVIIKPKVSKTVHCYWPRYQTVTQYWPKE